MPLTPLGSFDASADVNLAEEEVNIAADVPVSNLVITTTEGETDVVVTLVPTTAMDTVLTAGGVSEPQPSIAEEIIPSPPTSSEEIIPREPEKIVSESEQLSQAPEEPPMTKASKGKEIAVEPSIAPIPTITIAAIVTSPIFTAAETSPSIERDVRAPLVSVPFNKY